MKLIVVGGGAAGFFCAVNAARMNPGLQVIILERTNKLLSKVRISGGGRCNVTHACFSIPDMVKKYPRGANLVKKTFHQFFTTDTIEWFKERGVRLKTETDGRMFPVTDSSQTIIDCLLREADRYHVQVKMNCDVKNLQRKDDGWQIETGKGEVIAANFVCIACGGYPKSSMFEWLTATGHTIEEPVPSLFTFNMPGNSITQLMGVSVTSRVKISGTKFIEDGPILITHWGLSGPAILKLSATAARYLHSANYRFTALVNWMPAFHENSFNDKIREWRDTAASQKVFNAPHKLFDSTSSGVSTPVRLWEHLCSTCGIDEGTRWADLPLAKQNALSKAVTASEMRVEGKTTYKEEFVTAGGIRLAEVDPNTLESRIKPALYFAGEVLDVDGVTGGFNFQHAWTSGWVVAKSISR